VPHRVHIQNRQRKLKVDTDRVRQRMLAVLGGEVAAAPVEIGLVLLRDAPLAELNRQYRGRAGATDVLAFPVDASAWPPGEPRSLGEVVLSVDRAQVQARERGLDVQLELERLAVHGTLHLLGYRDATPGERARMRRREDRYLGLRTRRR